ncbi:MULTISPECIES: sulfurtransferase TusA family protein [Jonquetella]|uniref:Putative redox protein, regulator of disulfide bond formation n=1 Tax=Jonquetella anthropi DSM 22815 TaxID=885272 RepID=H0UJT8_9BACT|nr:MULTISPECIES: sulfurtransferase TusA family protein [Jonquetella]EEX48697.1 hypothetical protein GCWU000246_00723 [Jonquetella anthropi E3_33 E1]EHM12947.1 putative redox protein, regulator of disulfide bond formation [Jonquetella anthropi DSM 22815]ERL23491.1 sulfurtransferase TusA [Jonquetella sp. BV3C21]
MTIDARGLSCPEPVVLTRRAVVSAPAEFQVIVDNETARGNVIRFATHSGYKLADERQESGDWFLAFRK